MKMLTHGDNVDTVIVMSSRALRTLASMGSRKLRDFESRGASTGGCFYTLMKGRSFAHAAL